MKYVSLAVISLSLFLFSCKKDNAPEKVLDTKTKVAVNFSLGNFIQQVSDLNNPNARKSNVSIGSRESALPGNINYIYYAVYSTSGNYEKISYITQDYTNSSFGSIVDSLPIGNYYAVFAASVSPLNFTAGADLHGGRISANFSSANEVSQYPETFYKRVAFTVTSTGADIGSQMTLKRIIGGLKIKFKDAANAILKVEVLSESTGFNFETDLPFKDSTKNYSTEIPPNPDMPGDGYVGYVMNTNEEFSIRVTGHHFQTGETYDKVIDHVRCYPNKKTTLTGYLVSSNGSVRTGFDISIDNVWEEGPSSSF